MKKSLVAAYCLFMTGCHGCIDLGSHEFGGAGEGPAAGGADSAGGGNAGGQGGAAECKCFLGKCEKGVCQPFLIADTEQMPFDVIVTDGDAAVDYSGDGRLYWVKWGNDATTGELVRCQLGQQGEESRCLFSDDSYRLPLASGLRYPMHIAFGRNQREIIYTVELETGSRTIHLCDASSGGACDPLKTLTQGPYNIKGNIASHRGLVYIPTDLGVLIWSLETNAVEPLTSEYAATIAIDHPTPSDGVTHAGDRLIIASNLDPDSVTECSIAHATDELPVPCTPTTLSSGLPKIFSLAVANGEVYAADFTERDFGTLWLINRSGVNMTIPLTTNNVRVLASHRWTSDPTVPELLYYGGVQGTAPALGRVVLPAARPSAEAIDLEHPGSYLNYVDGLAQNVNGLYYSTRNDPAGAIWALDVDSTH